MPRPCYLVYNMTGSTQNAANFICVFNRTNRNATEALRQITIDYDFHVARHRGRVGANTRLTDSVIALRDDGVSIASITIGAGITGEVDSGAIDTYVKQGSEISILVDTSAGGGGSLSIFTGIFALKQGRGSAVGKLRKYNWFTIGCSDNSTTANTSRFNSLGSEISDTTENNMKNIIRFGFVVHRTRGRIAINSKNASSVISLRDDNAAVGAITVGAGVTGEVTSGIIDTMVAPGSSCNFHFDTSGSSSGSLEVNPMVAICKGTLPKETAQWSNQQFNGKMISITSNADNFFAFGLSGNPTTTEADRQITIDFDYIIDALDCNVYVNTKDDDTVIAIRDDGADALSITVGAGVTGQVTTGAGQNTKIASGSASCFNVDTSASSSGNFAVAMQTSGRAQI